MLSLAVHRYHSSNFFGNSSFGDIQACQDPCAAVLDAVSCRSWVWRGITEPWTGMS